MIEEISININATLDQYMIPLMIERYGKDKHYWNKVAFEAIKDKFKDYESVPNISD